ncbi:MAG TPA: 5-formyltetrahydrofolate cyclo-ligase [Thermoanaerobaculia bacterium]
MRFDESRSQADKQSIREELWSRLEESGEALFPGARGRIPNFRGAGVAADRLAVTPEWRRARAVKCNPDSPQRPVRLRALREGKVVYMAVPRLRQKKCFWELDPGRLRSKDLAKAATISGASALGRAVHPRDLPHIDLVVAGSVAVNRRGDRLGKGGGYSDLEFAVGREVGAIDERTRIATTVHAVQVLDRELPVTAHDFSLDLIATPDGLIRPRGSKKRRPEGVLTDHLTDRIRRDVPVLRDLGF